MGCHALLQGIFLTQGLNPGLCIAGGFFTVWATGEAQAQASSFVCIVQIWHSFYHENKEHNTVHTQNERPGLCFKTNVRDDNRENDPVWSQAGCEQNVTKQIFFWVMTEEKQGQQSGKSSFQTISYTHPLSGGFILAENTFLGKSFCQSNWDLISPAFANRPLAPGLAWIHHNRLEEGVGGVSVLLPGNSEWTLVKFESWIISISLMTQISP